MQSPFIENAIKNEVNNEITFNKKPFKKYVEELVKSNDKKNNFKLNLNSTYFPNNSKAAFPGEEQNDQPGINMEKIPFNYNEKIGLSMYPMNNEYSNMIFSNFPPFFAFNPMYNHLNLLITYYLIKIKVRITIIIILSITTIITLIHHKQRK